MGKDNIAIANSEKADTSELATIDPKQKEKLVKPLSEHEKTLVDDYLSKQRKAQSAAKFVVSKEYESPQYLPESNTGNGDLKEKADLMIASLIASTGAKDTAFAVRLLSDCINAAGLCSKNSPNKDDEWVTFSNAVMNTLNDLSPQDAVEGMLLSKIISLHFQGMGYLQRAYNAEMKDEIELYMNCAAKTMRLHNETLDTLMRYRRKGEQKVTVQHVNVSSGGQAIVADTMIAGRGGLGKNQ